MYQQKSILAIIPARSGSKGIPGKNIKLMNQKPLMAYTIEACQKAGIFDEVFVSTDSLVYAQIAQKYGANVPFLRPHELAGDRSTSTDVIVHVLQTLRQMGKTYDLFCLLQPTSPLRTEVHILESVQRFFESRADTLVSICELDHASFLNVTVDETGFLTSKMRRAQLGQRQDVSKEYRINGAIYLAGCETFLVQKSFYYGRTATYLMDAVSSMDIDEKYQFEYAEYVMRERERKKL